jgi:hypothetical protein
MPEPIAAKRTLNYHHPDLAHLAHKPVAPTAAQINREIALLCWAKEQAAKPDHEVIDWLPDHSRTDQEDALEDAITARLREQRSDLAVPVVKGGQGRSDGDVFTNGVVVGLLVAGALFALAFHLLTR